MVGIVGIVIALFGFKQGWDAGEVRPIMSWLIALSFWLSIAIGMLFLVQIWYVFHARWPMIIRRQCEHFMAAFPYLLFLFLPLLAIPFLHENPGLLWKWMDGHNELPGHGTVAEDPLYAWKSPFLNVQFFVVRAIGIFAVFNRCRLHYCANGLSTRILQETSITRTRLVVCHRLAFSNCHCNDTWFNRLVQVIGIPLVLDYVWGLVFSASIRAALASIVILTVILAFKGYLKGILKQAHRYDIACMMLAFTVFWAYISFSQYFLIYSANIP